MNSILKTKSLTKSQELKINDLWNDEYPTTLQTRFTLLLEGVENFCHYLIESNENEVMAWAVYFEKDNELRFSIIVNKMFQKRGLGKMLVQQLKLDLNEFYGWVIDKETFAKSDGTFYRSPLLFYKKQGFEILANQRIDNEILSAVKIKWKGAEAN